MPTGVAVCRFGRYEQRVSYVVTDREEIYAILRSLRRVAVLGIKTIAQAAQPAYYVPAYLAAAGIEVVPVPTYYPEVTEILGQPVVRTVAAIDGPIDLLDVFRRPVDLEAHVPDILAKKPPVVWLQLGIQHDGFARALTEAGIRVVEDSCLMVEHRAAVRSR
jgi:predicted CoA-binding protein